MPETDLCPECGLERNAGLCPRCMLKRGLDGPALSLGGDGNPGTTVDLGPPSVFETLTLSVGPIPHVLLRDTDDDDKATLVLPPSNPDADAFNRYQLQNELGHGGMGAVFKGRDPNLGRELAVKVLLTKHRNRPDLVRKFVEEAQIGGQLQHPGIVPVYELGTFADTRPYFTMKLVKGRTLAELLAGRTTPADDLARFLGIFEQVAQTLAYAHARGVIHRDLKPSNVMVGAFGEVQVMDWGLAKVLETDTVADRGAGAESAVRTVRTDADASQAGDVMGTYAYMPPEQATGDIDAIDERADVFGLGAFLCEILTGKPPYVGQTRGEVRRKAERADLSDAHARLDACGADAELLALARLCLEPDPNDRPRDAGKVASTMTAYFRGVQDRLRTAELERVEAETRAEEEVKQRELAEQLAAEAQARAVEERARRKLQVSLMAAVLAFFVLGGGGYAWERRQRDERVARTARGVEDALARAERLRGEAQAAPVSDLAKWDVALAAASEADGLIRQGEADAALRGRVDGLLAILKDEQAKARERARQAEIDRTLLAELESIRGNRSEHWDEKRTDAEYAAAFRKVGLDLDRMEPRQVGAWIANRSDPIELTSYLDDWLFARRGSGAEEASWRRLVEAARNADPDPWRDSLRARAGRRDADAVAEFRRLADSESALDSQPVASLHLLVESLENAAGDRERAKRVLRLAWQHHPGDFWVNIHLAHVESKGDGEYLDPGEAVRRSSVAVAVRPRSSTAHYNLGNALRAQGKLDDAVAEYRAAIRIKPNYAEAHNNLGAALQAQGKLDDAIAEYHAAIRIKPDLAEAHVGLGNALQAQGKLDDAIVEHRAAIWIKPNYAGAHYNLGNALQAQGKLDDAIAEYHAAIRIKPDHAVAHCNLGKALRNSGRDADALEELRRGHDLGSKQPGWRHPSLAWVRECERMVALDARLPAILKEDDKPKDAAEGLEFGQICYTKGLHASAARLWADALAADPKLAEDRQAPPRYDAACSAALAGSGKSKDDPPPDDAAKVKLRNQARDWLKAELAAWSKVLDNGTPEARKNVQQKLAHWKVDPDLAAIRDKDALAKLPEAERKEWEALWGEVDALIKTSSAGAPDEKEPRQ
jgi:serine/threonine-protein kinase